MSTNESKPRKPKRGHRLPHGEGSFYHRVTDNRWVGTIEAGTTIHGKRRRIVVTDKDEGRAWDKLQVKRKILLTEGRAAALQTSMTLEAWLTKWLEIQKATLRPEAYNGAASYVRRWMVPTLGRIQVEDLTPTHVRKLRDTAEWKALQDSLGAWKRPAADDSTGPVYWDAYEIRHSTATLLLAAKVDPEVVKAIMGHSDILVTRGYQHADIDMKREALEKVAAFLKGRPEPVKQLSAS